MKGNVGRPQVKSCPCRVAIPTPLTPRVPRRPAAVEVVVRPVRESTTVWTGETGGTDGPGRSGIGRRRRRPGGVSPEGRPCYP